MEIKGYIAMPVPQRSGMLHQHAYARQHKEKGAKAGNGSKLFVANAPLAPSRDFLLSAAEGAMEGVEGVTMGHVAGAGGAPAVTTSYITFGNPREAMDALNRPSWDLLAALDEAEAGSSPYVERLAEVYRDLRPEESDLKREVDSYMAAFDAAEDAEEKRRRALAQKVDADGYRTVVRGKKRRGEDIDGARRRKGKAKKKNYELKNFYRHQMREQKREALVKLREKFEEDKRKIAKMKELRKFRPY